MTFNPILATVSAILADAPSLMGNALSITWDKTKSQEGYLRPGQSWLGDSAPAPETFSRASRLHLMEMAPVLSREFQSALHRRMQSSMSRDHSEPARLAHRSDTERWGLDVTFQLSSHADMVRKVRVGRMVSVLDSVCSGELEVMVGLQIDCLRYCKALSNPFSAEHFAAALLRAVEVAIPDELQQQAVLQVLVPSFAQALTSSLRKYATTMTRYVQVMADAEEPDGPWRHARRDEQFEPTVPAAL